MQQALRSLAASLRQVAEETGMSYATLKAWSAGVRTPSAENLRQIADAAEQTSRAAEERREGVAREAKSQR